MTTEDVLNHHLASFAAGDVEEIMKDYTDDSILMTFNGRISGKQAIREAMAGFFEGLFRPGTFTFDMDVMDVEDDVAFIVWHSTNEGAVIPMGTDTFVVRDGKIVCQTFAAKIDPT